MEGDHTGANADDAPSYLPAIYPRDNLGMQVLRVQAFLAERVIVKLHRRTSSPPASVY
ncbi:MAG: hypothetical protein ABI361_12925 [Nitrososphaera sp.]